MKQTPQTASLAPCVLEKLLLFLEKPLPFLEATTFFLDELLLFRHSGLHNALPSREEQQPKKKGLTRDQDTPPVPKPPTTSYRRSSPYALRAFPRLTQHNRRGNATVGAQSGGPARSPCPPSDSRQRLVLQQPRGASMLHAGQADNHGPAALFSQTPPADSTTCVT